MTENRKTGRKEFLEQNAAYENISLSVDIVRLNSKRLGIVPLSLLKKGKLWLAVVGRRSLETFVPDYLLISSPESSHSSIRRTIQPILDDFAQKDLKTPVPIVVHRSDSPPESDILPSLVISDDLSGVEIVPGRNSSPLAGLSGENMAIPVIPVPLYHVEMPVYQKAMILTRSLALYPPVNMKTMLTSGVIMAYSRSIGFSRDFIHRDLNDIMNTLIRSRTFIRRGEFVYFPYNSDEFRRRFVRNYLRYTEMISKKTIFDYSTE